MFQVAEAAKARQIAAFREEQAKNRALGAKGGRLTLESLQAQIAEGGMKELPIIIKADVQGSAEVLADTLAKLSDDKVKIRIIHSGVGAVNESDVLLGTASKAIIIAFNVRPDRNAEQVASREGVDIRQHSIIYNVTDEMKKAMVGLLEPTFKEVRIGVAEVRDIFKVPKFGTIAGCMVTEGRITRSGDTQARLLRDERRSSSKARSGRSAASRTTSARSRPASSAASASTSTTTSGSATSSKSSRWSASPLRRKRRARRVTPQVHLAAVLVAWRSSRVPAAFASAIRL